MPNKILGTGGGLPTKAIATVDGLLPDETRHTEVRDYVDARIGGFSVLVDGTPQFPTRLRAERNPLPVFYYRGDISLLDSRCVSVVGTRHPSECGELAARRVARALVGEGITVVIGLAAGIDTAAAREALDAGGRVIGVIGMPIDRYYPRENRDLQERVATGHLLISQVPTTEATVIVEAGETSGTRMQAKACIDQGKRLILLPGVMEETSWAKGFVKRGAVVASSVTDVMRILR